jgi:hypothetical protein
MAFLTYQGPHLDVHRLALILPEGAETADEIGQLKMLGCDLSLLSKRWTANRQVSSCEKRLDHEYLGMAYGTDSTRVPTLFCTI